MEQLDKGEIKIIAGFLASSLEIEDDMSSELYGEFLNREIWPSNLSEEIFQVVKKFLTTVIQETEGHKKLFSNLLKEIKNNDQR